MGKLLFCPKCHRQIQNPIKGDVKISGKLVINCSHCGKGKVVIKEDIKA
jgi:RNase P subunit RPR2